MKPTKVIEFIGSNEHFDIIKKIGNFLNINWGDERMPKIINLTEDILRYNQTAETQVKELIKKWLDFLNEEEINNLYKFLAENFLLKVRELWQEETHPETKEIEEPFEEREKRYLELMKELIKYPRKSREEPKKKEIGEEKKEDVEYKTITFEPKEEHRKETPVETLPEEIILPEERIIITKKKEEEIKKEEEDFLDLSKL